MLTACISFGVAMTTNTHFRGEELKKVWLNRYPADVPTEINPDRYQSLVDMFEQSVARYADQPAFVNMGEVMTFRKLEERSRAFAAYLQQGLGLKKGDRVALMMPNLLQYPVALMEAMAVGIPVVSTLHSGIPELVEADKSGWLVPENDARALAQRLAAFSQLDTDELAPVVKRAREKVEHDFNQQVINRELASLLQAL